MSERDQKRSARSTKREVGEELDSPALHRNENQSAGHRRREPSSRGGQVEGQRGQRDQADGERSREPARPARAEPKQEDRLNREASGQPVPVADRIAQPSLGSRKKHAEAAIAVAEQRGIDASPKRGQADDRQPHDQPRKPRTHATPWNAEPHECEQADVSGDPNERRKGPPGIVGPEHRQGRQDAQAGKASARNDGGPWHRPQRPGPCRGPDRNREPDRYRRGRGQPLGGAAVR